MTGASGPAAVGGRQVGGVGPVPGGGLDGPPGELEDPERVGVQVRVAAVLEFVEQDEHRAEV